MTTVGILMKLKGHWSPRQSHVYHPLDSAWSGFSAGRKPCQSADDRWWQPATKATKPFFAFCFGTCGVRRLLFHSIPFRRLVCHPDQGARNLYLRLMYFAAFENKPLYIFWWKCRNLESINFRELGCLIPKCNDAKMCRDPKKAVQHHPIWQ